MSVLKKLKTYTRKKLGIEEDRQNLQGQIHYLSALAQVGLSEVIEPAESFKNHIRAIGNQQLPREVFLGIHKNDIMFRHHLYHHAEDPDLAFKTYFEVGMDIARKCRELALENGFKGKKILDFGSGYGRASRFLPHFFPDSDISVSEVKPKALDFQKDYFKYRTLSHTTDASSLPDERFDLIIAASVFTHLPEEHFKRWFARMCQALNEKGLMIFSFNNIERIQHPADPHFHYTDQSEDSAFIISDRLKDPKDYGLTFVSKALLSELAADVGVQIRFKDNQRIGKQEIAILSLNKRSGFSQSSR